jgi:hypothetical protein
VQGVLSMDSTLFGGTRGAVWKENDVSKVLLAQYFPEP